MPNKQARAKQSAFVANFDIQATTNSQIVEPESAQQDKDKWQAVYSFQSKLHTMFFMNFFAEQHGVTPKRKGTRE